MKTNDLKKGTRIQLRNGWYATLADNAKGNRRMADVEGDFREIGSVYSHDIMRAHVLNPFALHTDGVMQWVGVEHTPAQVKLRATVAGL